MHPNAAGDTQRMSLDAALRKIKACAGVARSSNPNEAARALQQMQALMAEFKIDDLELADITFTDTPRARGGKGAPPWLLALAALVARVFHTQSVQSSGSMYGGARTSAIRAVNIVAGKPYSPIFQLPIIGVLYDHRIAFACPGRD